MQQKVFLLSLSILFFLASCRHEQPKVASKPNWVIDEKKMVDMIVDLRIVDAASYTNSSGPPRNKANDWYFVMKKYKVQDSIFRKSHDYYCKYPDVLSSIYEQAIDKLSEMQAQNVESSGLVDTLKTTKTVEVVR